MKTPRHAWPYDHWAESATERPDYVPRHRRSLPDLLRIQDAVNRAFANMSAAGTRLT